jgi:hypothetical protein
MEQQKLELIDIYDIVYEPWWLSSAAKVVACVVVFIMCVATSYLIYRKTRKPVVLLYWQEALHAIDTLEKTDYSDGQIFYLRLTEIMKQYLQAHYGMHLVDKTDTELLELLKTTERIPSHVYETMRDLFEGVIFIKFAHQQAVHERMEDALKKAQALIHSLQNS